MQQLGDLDIEGVFPYFERLQKHFQDHPDDRLDSLTDIAVIVVVALNFGRREISPIVAQGCAAH